MKIRNGFVSNSSSSSFTCDVCGETCSGMDMSLSDAEMYECKGNHIICDCHIKDEIDYYDMTFKQKKEYCISITDWDYSKDKVKGIESEEELDEFYENDLCYDARYNLPKSQCPCCMLDSPASKEVMAYLLHCVGKGEAEVKTEMKSKFSNVDEMYKQIEK